ncbi:MAG: S8 family serine peptidase [Flavobacteriales bacterium]|nr:S8 family serine peptidase [Flavobacteriales bacterium]
MRNFLGTISTLVALQLGTWVSAQTAPDTYWVQFTDKAETPYSLDQPEDFLSARAIARRAAQNIAYDELDLPVDPAYIEQVRGLGEVQVLTRSKWFNGITVRTTDADVVATIRDLPFVHGIRPTGASLAPPSRPKFEELRDLESYRDGEEEFYGPSFRQIAMLNGHLLHSEGAQGQGMLIGVLDSGFEGVDASAAFSALRDRNGIVLARDLVDGDDNVYDAHAHGRSVLSCMASNLEGQLVGTAPGADYVLLRTEDVATEYPIEEDNWVMGAELADSLGCDVLNTSLGYTEFDDSTMDHSYADLDGRTLRISIAAGIASRKGMIPVNSAGNSGSSPWHFISAPADAIDILTVGAVGDLEQHAPFSSFGPSADGRVKPDVCAMGWGTTVLRPGVDSVASANGTSFAAPVLAGLVACLWQLHPTRNAQEVMEAVRSSASFFHTPNDAYGFGVPDFNVASDILEFGIGMDEHAVGQGFLLFPSPFDNVLGFVAPVDGPLDVILFDATGRSVWQSKTLGAKDEVVQLADGRLGTLPAGMYVVRLQQGRSAWQQRSLKLP